MIFFYTSLWYNEVSINPSSYDNMEKQNLDCFMLKFHRLGILTFRQVSFLIVKQYKQINQGVSFPDFLGIPVYVATVYLSGTKELCQ